MKNVCRGLIKRHRSLGRVRSCFCYAIDWKIPSEDRLSGNDSGTFEFYFHDGTFQLIRIPFVPDINQPTRQFFSLREPPTDRLLARYSDFSLRNLKSKLFEKYILPETRATMHGDAEVRFAFRDPLRPISSVSNRQANNSRDDVNQPTNSSSDARLSHLSRFCELVRPSCFKLQLPIQEERSFG